MCYFCSCRTTPPPRRDFWEPVLQAGSKLLKNLISRPGQYRGHPTQLESPRGSYQIPKINQILGIILNFGLNSWRNLERNTVFSARHALMATRNRYFAQREVGALQTLLIFPKKAGFFVDNSTFGSRYKFENVKKRCNISHFWLFLVFAKVFAQLAER